ncbi:hypothetical protein ACQ4LE_005065 [Meloidogyne hapla]
MDSPSTEAYEDFENKKASDNTTNYSRGATPTVLTSFSEALNEKNFEGNEMKDVQLYEEICSDEEDKSINEDANEQNEEDIGETGQEREDNDAATSEKHLEFESLSQIKNSQLGKTVVIHSNDETPQETFSRLKDACIEGTLTYEDIMDGLFNTLVGGPFDLESRYVLKNCENVKLMLELTDLCPPKIQAEIWSIFVAIVKKSFLNLEICSKAGLVSLLLDRLPDADFIIADLFIQLLTVLTGYSISVKEFKHFLKSLKVVNNSWERNSIKLLNVMAEMPKRGGPDVFFAFPGKASAGMFIPPLTRWPHQNGWTFCTWFRMDPLNSVYFEREKPFLFNFSTSKGNGYFSYFMGSCLVLRCIRAPGKEIMRCIKYEFMPRKWYHIALTFIYSRWSKGEIHCFVDGCLVEVIDANWLVSQNEHFDHCYIGCGHEADEGEAFSGQMAAIYVLSQSITPQQAACLHYLGSSYQSHFKHKSESNLPENYKKLLFDGKLSESIIFSYCPKDCHGQMVLSHLSNTSKTSTNSYFVQVPHAIMKNGVEVITTHSIHNSLHSVGGIQTLLPLFSQIDMARDEPVEEEICSKLLAVIATLLGTSLNAQQQFLQCRGFSVISNLLQNASHVHLSMNLLESFISMSKAFINFNNGLPLLKQLVESVFLASHLWLKAEPSVQVRLYTFLSNEFFSNIDLLQIVRRTQTVVILMNTLKKYWITLPNDYTEEETRGEDVEEDENVILQKSCSKNFDRSAIVHIRTCILKLVYNFTFLCCEGNEERDDELQCIFNFIATTNEDDNLYDVLTQTMQQISDHPAILVPAFDKKKVICIIFNLISSPNELIKIPALKMFGYYLCRSTQKRKNESINQRNLFHLLTDKLSLNSRLLSLATYNALFEILVELVCPEILFVKHEELPIENTRFENPQILKVVAQLLIQSEESMETLRVKRIFLQDMIRHCKDCRENRRIILQMSVWQEWLISLSYIYPENEEQKHVSELCFQLFSILLFHAIRLEYGGWRVWVDTMAIAHSKVSWQKYRKNLIEKQEDNRKKLLESNNLDKSDQSGGISALYRTPDFVWSEVQIHFLSDLLMLIQAVVQEWKESPSSISDHLNNSDNHVFITNTVHIFSQLSDSLVMACGGLLPLLAAATAPTSELELFDTTQQELDISDAAFFLESFAEIADVFIFTSPLTLNELEQEKNMPAGGILRQALRLSATSAVRGILSSSLSNNESIFGSEINSTKYEAIRKFIKNKSTNIEFKDQLLQTVDLQRLKNLIYRDMEEVKQAQFLALSIVYFLSVLMVSRYRDILEPPPQQQTNLVINNSGGSKKEMVNNRKSSVTEHSEKLNSILEEERNEENGSSYINKNEEENEKEENDEINSKTSEGEEQNNNEVVKGISSIQLNENSNETTNNNENSDTNKYEPHHLTSLNRPDFAPSSSNENSIERRRYLTDKLQNSIEPVIPLFREILCDFRSFLQKTLLGTHGQEIMNDVRVMHTLKNGSVIEIVMLLCSQEWQTSLQKHSGLAFIELVNEGRLMAHATRDHILRVANEADFILNRLRAEDVRKHAQFESEVNDQLQHRKTEEQLSNQLIISARRREFIQSTKFLEKVTNILTSPTGAWFSDLQKNMPKFEKLDVWEDDSRMRRRFVHNPHGKRHSISNETTKNFDENKIKKDEDLNKLLKDLARKIIASGDVSKTNVLLQQFVEEAEIERLIREEENNSVNTSTNGVSENVKNGQSTFSTFAKLIAPGVIVPGTITLTGSDLYFDADEDDQSFKQNLQVGEFFFEKLIFGGRKNF